MFDSSNTLWELAAAEVHRRETDRDDYGGVEVAGERTVFVMGSKAGVSSSSSDIKLPYFRFYGCSLIAIFLAHYNQHNLVRSPLSFFRVKRPFSSDALTGERCLDTQIMSQN